MQIVRVCVVRVQLDRVFELFFCQVPVPVVDHQNGGECGVCFCKVIVEFQSSVRIGSSFLERLSSGEVEMTSHQGIAVRHSRVSQGVVRVLLYCFSKIRNCSLEVFLGPLAPVVSSS